jgi:hypothetical protein
MKSILIKVYVTVERSEDAKAIADDINDILDKSGITNNVELTNEESF